VTIAPAIGSLVSALATVPPAAQSDAGTCAFKENGNIANKQQQNLTMPSLSLFAPDGVTRAAHILFHGSMLSE